MVFCLLQDDIVYWSNKDPVSFHLWKPDYLIQSSLFVGRAHHTSEYCSKNIFASIRDITSYLSEISSNASAICAVLLLLNMAEPAWSRVECDKQLFSKFLCYFEEPVTIDYNNTFIENNIITDEMIFNQSCVLKNKICYLFEWIEVKPNDMSHIGANQNVIKLFEYLFYAINVEFPPIISPDFSKRLTYKKYGQILNYKWHSINNNASEGLYIMKDLSINFQKGENLFDCGNGILISIKFSCDGENDCSHIKISKDELGCLCNRTSSYTPNCKYFADKHRKKCSFYYWMTDTNKCEPYYNLESISQAKENKEILALISDQTKSINNCKEALTKVRLLVENVTHNFMIYQSFVHMH